jgi:hypothetical protein
LFPARSFFDLVGIYKSLKKGKYLQGFENLAG